MGGVVPLVHKIYQFSRDNHLSKFPSLDEIFLKQAPLPLQFAIIFICAFLCEETLIRHCKWTFEAIIVAVFCL